MAGIDFSKRYKDFARFLPATSEMFTRFVTAANPKRPCPVPQSDLDFLNPNSSLYYLPCALYSAGQAAKSSGAAHRKDMITGRDKSHTTILGDSGGFQIQQGSIRWAGDVTRNRMMLWLEDNCDWSMILDFPTGGIGMGTTTQHTRRLIKDNDITRVPVFAKDSNFVERFETMNLLDFLLINGVVEQSILQHTLQALAEADDANRAAALDAVIDLVVQANIQGVGFFTCMFQTIVNNEYFIEHRRPGATRFLNVIQGRNSNESQKWYEAVKRYSDPNALDAHGVVLGERAFEGWSLAGPHKENFEITVSRLLDMRRDGLLKDKNWMHILGVGKLANGCAYTTMQRAIREHDNPDFTISYDVSSPFTTAAFGNLFMGYTLDKNGWTIQSCKLDSREFLFDKGATDEHGNLLFEPLEPRVEAAKPPKLSRKEKAALALLEAQATEPAPARAPRKSPVHPEPMRGGKAGTRSYEVFLDVLGQEWDKLIDNNPKLAQHSRFIRTQIGTTGVLDQHGVATDQPLRMGDLCVNIDPRFTSTWDVVTYALLMHHNVQVHLEAVFESQDLYDQNDRDRVPLAMLELKQAIQTLLDPANPDPQSDIRRYYDTLNCLAGEAADGGVPCTELFVMAPNAEHAAALEANKHNAKAKASQLVDSKDRRSVAQKRTDGQAKTSDILADTTLFK